MLGLLAAQRHCQHALAPRDEFLLSRREFAMPCLQELEQARREIATGIEARRRGIQVKASGGGLIRRCNHDPS